MGANQRRKEGRRKMRMWRKLGVGLSSLLGLACLLQDPKLIALFGLGYLNQHDLVWEKLNEVNGDTLFMTGNFKEFKVENQSNENWNEDNAVTSTADYLASIDSAASTGLDINSDLQLAIALQQQEFEQQPPQQQHRQVVSFLDE